MGLITTLVVGGLIGWFASLIMKTSRQMGVLGSVLVGIVGAWVGRWLFGLLGLAAFGRVGHIVVSVVGALVLIALLRALGVYR
jgi:uncharacterized membrane protein YeaQ/YmgE (transglycosylase-associated protein family)